MEKKNNSLVIILMGVIIVILAVLCILFATDTISFNINKSNSNEGNNQVKEEENSNNNAIDNSDEKIDTFGINDTFSISTESGQVDVLGYVEIIKREPSEFDSTNSEKINYVYFHITDTKSNDFLKYIDNMKGNSFVSDKSIGLGCRIDNLIKYYNSSNQNGFKEYNLSLEDSNKIFNSNVNNPIKLRLNRLELSGGKDAPSCYSHITKIEVIDD